MSRQSHGSVDDIFLQATVEIQSLTCHVEKSIFLSCTKNVSLELCPYAFCVEKVTEFFQE